MQAGNSIGGAISPGRPRRRGAELRAGRREAVRRGDARAAGRHPGDAGTRRQAVEGGRPRRRARRPLRRQPVRRRRDLGRSTRRIRARRRSQKFTNIGKQPYDALVTPDGRWYIAGLFGEDGLALLDLWHPERGVDAHPRRATAAGEEKLPVYKMPHLRGWAIAGRLRVPAGGRPPRGAGRRHARPGSEVARDPGRRPAGVRDRAAGRRARSGSTSRSRTTTRCR